VLSNFDLRVTRKGLKRTTGVYIHDFGETFFKKHSVPGLAHGKVGGGPRKFGEGMSQPETVDAGIGGAIKLAFDYAGGFCAESLGACDVAAQPALDGKNIEGGFGVDIHTVGIVTDIFGKEVEMSFANTNGFARIIKEIIFHIAGKMYAEFIGIFLCKNHYGNKCQG